MTASRGAATLRLQTDRLDLIALTAELAEALADRDRAERLLGAALPAGWPDDELTGLLKIYRPWIVEEPAQLGYGPWVLVARDEGSVVGSAGFLGKPADNDGSIEIGYGVHRDYRSRGYATEATRALVEWALSQPAVDRVIAKCDPQNAPSVRVLEKIGMTRSGEEDAMLLWEASAGRDAEIPD
jgi:[ribosomal protein S5]-alanine N-acetyltransferase